MVSSIKQSKITFLVKFPHLKFLDKFLKIKNYRKLNLG